MPKNKPNKGLLKRVRITASGRVKFGRAFARHKRSHKSGKLLRSYRRSAYAHPSDVRRVASMLHRRLTAKSTTTTSDRSSVETKAPVTTAAVETAPVETKTETVAKATTKKAPAKKAAAKKTPAKKTAAKKTPAKKTTAKKTKD